MSGWTEAEILCVALTFVAFLVGYITALIGYQA